jgi:ketosteroid isomerase-like protein
VAVRAAIGGMMSDPRFSLSFHADQVVASRSGDLVYEIGSYAMTFSGEGGKTMRQTGRYVDVWRKQADGSWKVVLDAPVSDATNPM